MRIISGRFKSRRLKAAPPGGIRPTSDKLKETVFNILGPRVEGSTFLDGCAGMGGIGLEAISREASMVYFVDQNRKACRFIRENLKSLEIDKGYRLIETDIVKALDMLADEKTQFDIAYVDPPYDRQDVYLAVLDRFSTRDLLAPGGMLILEHSKPRSRGSGFVPNPTVGTLELMRSVVQGDSALSFYGVMSK